MENVTASLANYIVATTIEDLPPDVRHQAKRTFLNFIGCAVGGAFDDSVNLTVRALGTFSGPPKAAALGRGERYDVLLASLLNGMSSAVYSFDDTHAQAVVHAGGPVGSALLSYAETRTVSGSDFLTAFTLGVETVCRVSKAISVSPASVELKWIQTGICAGIGAAAAVGKLMKLSAAQLAWAIGIAAAQAGGIRGLSRSMCFSLMAGQAARSGLAAALLAQQGFNSTNDPLGIKDGFAQSYSDASNLDALTNGLGETFEILSNTFKPYPCGVVIHPVIDVCLEIVRDRSLSANDVDRVHVEINPTSAGLSDLKHPQSPSEAQMSLQHWVAAALHDREAGIRQSRPEKLVEPAVVSLRDKVEISPTVKMRRESAAVTIHLSSGDVLRGSVQNCRGSQSRPMTDHEIEDKFRVQCAERLTVDNADSIARHVWSLDSVADCACISELALGTHGIA